MVNNPPNNMPTVPVGPSWDAIIGLLAMLAVKQNCNCPVCKVLNNIINRQLENIIKLLLEGEKDGKGANTGD